MKIRHVAAALVLVIVFALGLLLAGCGQSDEQVVTSSCPASSEGVSVTCEGKDGDLTCAVTCSGAEGSSEYVVTCEGKDGEKTCTVTCDGKTVACNHAEGEECTCAKPAGSGCPAASSDGSGTCPGMARTADSGGSCASKAAGKCPMSGAVKVTEGSTK